MNKRSFLQAFSRRKWVKMYLSHPAARGGKARAHYYVSDRQRAGLACCLCQKSLLKSPAVILDGVANRPPLASYCLDCLPCHLTDREHRIENMKAGGG